jgi:hypothetical protein
MSLISITYLTASLLTRTHTQISKSDTTHSNTHRERKVAIKRRSALVIGNMCKLVNDPRTAALFYPVLKPVLIKGIEEIPVEEVRKVCQEVRNGKFHMNFLFCQPHGIFAAVLFVSRQLSAIRNLYGFKCYCRPVSQLWAVLQHCSLPDCAAMTPQ